MYNYGYSYGYDYGYRQIETAFTTIFWICLIAAIIFSILMIVAWCKLFRKAGKPWGFYFIPIYGTYLTYSIADCGGLFWANLIVGILDAVFFNLFGFYDSFMFTFPLLLVMLILHISYCKKLAEAFGKGAGFIVGLIFLRPIFIMILAYGSARHYNNPDYGSYAGYTVTSSWTCTCGTHNPSSRITCENCGAINSSSKVSRENMVLEQKKVTSIWTCACGTINSCSRLTCENCGAHKR
ncbi:MAG: hypothetical protein E7316_11170 [Clostridiales bacterium]|nr:hypothetical protein [Clostridiales bacterium]